MRGFFDAIFFASSFLTPRPGFVASFFRRSAVSGSTAGATPPSGGRPNGGRGPNPGPEEPPGRGSGAREKPGRGAKPGRGGMPGRGGNPGREKPVPAGAAGWAARAGRRVAGLGGAAMTARPRPPAPRSGGAAVEPACGGEEAVLTCVTPGECGPALAPWDIIASGRGAGAVGTGAADGPGGRSPVRFRMRPRAPAGAAGAGGGGVFGTTGGGLTRAGGAATERRTAGAGASAGRAGRAAGAAA